VRKNNGFSENNKDYRGCFKRKSRVYWQKNIIYLFVCRKMLLYLPTEKQ
jgi:hypothetical protein